jgi:hypothetical protein
MKYITLASSKMMGTSVSADKNSEATLFCEAVAKDNKQILITTMIKSSKAEGWYVKPGTPVPNDSAAATKRIQTEIIASIAKENEDYLGKVNFILVRQELADVILFPRSPKIVFCIVVQRPYDLDRLTESVLIKLDAFQPVARSNR